ncbi:MAG: endonuclease/exonuclease/phosphatase family protein, partial [Actinobacteria bacterium]|nr:endonuclease/exonuclease/phosphatase family protein [Actinomycetota bacterium]
MPLYADLRTGSLDDRRTAERLLVLKDRLSQIPPRTIDNLLLATWNIREFDSSSFGFRTTESLLCIAEIVNRFDLVAVQEVREELVGLERLRRLLGGWWRYVVTDVTLGARGNRERTAFLYDARKISFGGLAGELVIPPLEHRGRPSEPAKQLARTPFMVGFRAGWFAFTICTVHILYGEDKAVDPERLDEIRMVADFLAERATEKHAWAPNMIVLGDFNIFSTGDETMQALLDAGFVIPDELRKHPSNAPRTKHYDQIGFITPDLEDQLGACKAGAFNYYDTVFTDADESLYEKQMGSD